ncbi:hypothetical protein [Hymenobacter lapidiphilus]|uniref:DUF3168 domain-containing protein n=1 Tax=Hymenobacter lapidiphilus TaxID=2608003 RepID=A0A7Y7PSK5_9BACT|nr:hypothetical protein [Hymenobacter lapidiphilus]NVO33264.1 hypothetical protein [Hymenobacter lapidiphilus]
MTPDAQALAYIRAAALSAFAGGPGFFQHGTVVQNSLSSSEQTPQVFLFDPRPKQDSQAGGLVKLDCTLSFLDVEPGDGDDPLAGEEAILRMGLLKDRLLAYLDLNPLLELSGLQWEAERMVYSTRFTGIVCRFTLSLPRSAAASACAIV